MSPWLFSLAILEGRTIDVFNHGKMQRDCTFIDDIAQGTVRVLDKVAQPNPAYHSAQPDHASSHAPYRVYTIGNHTPVALMEFIGSIEQALGQEAKKNFLPVQPGDEVVTYADVLDLQRDVGFEPSTALHEGLEQWVRSSRQFPGL